VYNHEWMAFNRPIPENMRGEMHGGRKQPSGFKLYVQAEKMLQIAFVLPCALVIGWVLGAWADRWLHQSWMTIAGVVLGCVSGLVFVIRMALAAEKDTKPDGVKGPDAAASAEKRDDSESRSA
jgi:F0F1-type ATP synthase assembly protein I